MSDETQDPADGEIEPKAEEKFKTAVAKTVRVADKAGNAVEMANNAFSAVKWVAIAVVMLTVLGFGYGAYKLLTRPVVAVTDAAGKMADAVGDKAGAIKDGADKVVNRLVIPVQDQANLDTLAEAIFERLHIYPTTKPSGVKERLFRMTNFGDSENRVCQMSVNFGGGDLTAYAGANNEDYAKSKALGSKNDRVIHFIISAKGDDIPLNVAWDNDTGHWVMKWRASMVKKPLDNSTAQARLLDLLREAKTQCDAHI